MATSLGDSLILCCLQTPSVPCAQVSLESILTLVTCVTFHETFCHQGKAWKAFSKLRSVNFFLPPALRKAVIQLLHVTPPATVQLVSFMPRAQTKIKGQQLHSSKFPRSPRSCGCCRHPCVDLVYRRPVATRTSSSWAGFRAQVSHCGSHDCRSLSHEVLLSTKVQRDNHARACSHSPRTPRPTSAFSRAQISLPPQEDVLSRQPLNRQWLTSLSLKTVVISCVMGGGGRSLSS